jgi:hypothetical protein
VRRKTWALAATVVVAVATATGGVAVMSSAKQATAAAPQLPVGTAQVERRPRDPAASRALPVPAPWLELVSATLVR